MRQGHELQWLCKLLHASRTGVAAVVCMLLAVPFLCFATTWKGSCQGSELCSPSKLDNFCSHCSVTQPVLCSTPFTQPRNTMALSGISYVIVCACNIVNLSIKLTSQISKLLLLQQQDKAAWPPKIFNKSTQHSKSDPIMFLGAKSHVYSLGIN